MGTLKTNLVTLLALFLPFYAYGLDKPLSPCEALITKQASIHELFDASKSPTPGYSDLVKNKLSNGDTLKFSDGTEFLVSHTLGHGFTTLVLAVYAVHNGVQDDTLFALRIPISDKVLNPRTTKVPVRSFINKYFDGYEILHENKIPVPTLYGHLSEEYNLTEFIQVDIKGYDFFARPEKVPAHLLPEAEEALIDFAKIISRFDHIGDFKADQMAYNKTEKRWYLLDWTDNNTLFNYNSTTARHHLFDNRFKESLETESGRYTDRHERALTEREVEIIEKLINTVHKARKEANRPFFRRLLDKLKGASQAT